MFKKSNALSKKVTPFFLFCSFLAPFSVLQAETVAGSKSDTTLPAKSAMVSKNNLTSEGDIASVVVTSGKTLSKDGQIDDLDQSKKSARSAVNRKVNSKNQKKKIYRILVEEDFVSSIPSEKDGEDFRPKNRPDMSKRASLPQKSEHNSLTQKAEIDPCFCCKQILRFLEIKDRAESLDRSRRLGEYNSVEKNNQQDYWNIDQRSGFKSNFDQHTEEENRWILNSDQDETLSKNLQNWCDKAGWTLVWKASCDYPIEANAAFSGEFTTAVRTLIDAYKDADLPLRADLYEKQQLVVISLF